MDRLKERHRFSDCLYWNLFALIPFLTACFAIARSSILWVVIYVLIFFGHFILFEYRFFCTHCPHYCNDTKTTRCMFLWGVPKIFKKRPSPLGAFDLIMVAVGFAVAIFLPLYWLLDSWPLFTVYFLSWITLALTLKRYECPRCTYFSCPANSVAEGVKREYQARG